MFGLTPKELAAYLSPAFTEYDIDNTQLTNRIGVLTTDHVLGVMEQLNIRLDQHHLHGVKLVVSSNDILTYHTLAALAGYIKDATHEHNIPRG